MYVHVGSEKEMRRAERNLLKPNDNMENTTPAQKRKREDSSQNGSSPKKARKSTKGTPSTARKASKYNYKELCNRIYTHYIANLSMKLTCVYAAH